jgi:hypothetical protein
MPGFALAGLPRRAVAAMSGRATLAALAGAAMAPAVLPLTPATAGKAGKTARKKCKRQVGQCRAAWEELCMGNSTCEEDFFACCEHLRRCNVSAYLACTFEVDP